MKIKENHDNPYQLYHKPSHAWVEVTPEQYEIFNRECSRIRKYEQFHHRCMCPRRKFWLCDGMCEDCEFHAPGDTLSLDIPASTNEGDETSLFDTLLEPNEAIEDIILLKECLAKLEKVMPEAQKVVILRLQGYSDTEIAEKLNIKRTTLLSRFKKALKKLGIQRSDFI